MKTTIYHVLDKMTMTHHYFGSIVGIFSLFGQDEIKTSPNALYRHDFDVEPFDNQMVTIWKGSLVRSKQMPR